MKKLFGFGVFMMLTLAIIWAQCVSGSNQGLPNSPKIHSIDPYEQAQALGKGVNFGNLLDADPSEGSWTNGLVIEKSHFTLAKNAGFDSVRIPICFAAHALQTPPYTIDKTFFKRIDQVVDWGLSAGLKIVINIHHYNEFTDNPQAHQSRFIEIWKQIASRYKGYPDTLYFEMLNEPCKAITTDIWNKIIADCSAAVRKIDKRHTLIVGCTDYSNPSGLSGLRIPATETNAIVTFHYYNPSLFCFQGKSFMGTDWSTSGISWPGPPASPVTPASGVGPWVKEWIDSYNNLPLPNNPASPELIREEIATVAQWGREHHRPLWMSEFTAQDGADLNSRSRWMECVRKELESNKIPWSVWTLLSDSGSYIYDIKTGQWIIPLTQALGLKVSNSKL